MPCTTYPSTALSLHEVRLSHFRFRGSCADSYPPPIGRSYHAVVTACFTSAAPHINQPTTRKVWRYSSADWGRLRHFFGTTDWLAVINDNPNHSGLNITQHIQGKEKFIPSKILTTLPSDPMVVTRAHASNGGQEQSLEGLEK